MDPNANLQEQERILNEPAAERDNARLRELRAALDGWLRGNGFPPTWETCPKASRRYKEYREAYAYMVARRTR